MSRLCRPDPQHNIETKFIKAGGVVFCESDEAHELSVIKSGQVRIQLGNRTWAELSDNDIFGEMALIDNELQRHGARPADVELVAVSEKQFLFLVGQTLYFARAGAAAVRHQQDLRLIPRLAKQPQDYILRCDSPFSADRTAPCHSRR